MPKYNPNSIWGSKEKQYAYNPKPSGQNAPQSGGTPSSPQPKEPQSETHGGLSEPPSFFHRHRLFFFFSALLLVLALVSFVVYLLIPAPGPNVGISFSKPDQVMVGVPFTLSVTVSNESNSLLKNASLGIYLPPGVSFVGQDATQQGLSPTIGDLQPGSITPETFTLIVTGNPQSVQHINAKLTYNPNVTSNTQLETDGEVDVIVGDPAIALSYSATSNIFSGQDFDIVVNYQNNSSEIMRNVQIQMQYPPVFSFTKSSITPTNAANDNWDVGDLAPNATGTFTITGNIVGPQQAQYQLNGSVSADFSGQTYAENSQPINFLIASSPLSLSIAINNSSSYVSNEGDNLNYVLTYTNNSNVTFQNISITASLVGKMFDLSSLRSAGSFDSRSNTITWYTANTPSLLSLAPGQSGSVDFSISTLGSFPIRLPSDKNYLLKVSAQIESPTVPPNTSGSNTVSVVDNEVKVGGNITMTSQGYWHDAKSGILNSGPYPPKVNQPTEYTVHWAVTNYSTDAENVTLSAYVQSGSTFTGQVKSNVSSSPVYDPETGLITWTIPLIPATVGVISPPVEAIFQLSNTPAINQVGQYVTILGPTTLTATDAFTSSTIQVSTDPVTTEIPDDTTVDQNSRTVSQ